MTTKTVPFFEYPRLWTDDRDDFLSIIDSVSSTGGFILQQAVFDFENELAEYAETNYSIGVGNATDGMEIFLEFKIWRSLILFFKCNHKYYFKIHD